MSSPGDPDGSGSSSPSAEATTAVVRSYGQRIPHDRQSHSPEASLRPTGAVLLRSCNTDSDGPPAMAGTTNSESQRGHTGLEVAGTMSREVTMPRTDASGTRGGVRRACSNDRTATLRGTASLASPTPAVG